MNTPMCRRCWKQPARVNRTRCAECAGRDSAETRTRYALKLEARRLVDPMAGTRRIAPPCQGCIAARAGGRRRCPAHLAADVVMLKARRAKARAEHRCYYCKLPAREGRTTCVAHAGGNQHDRRRRGRV
jgi:hypothetical protein